MKELFNEMAGDILRIFKGINPNEPGSIASQMRGSFDPEKMTIDDIVGVGISLNGSLSVIIFKTFAEPMFYGIKRLLEFDYTRAINETPFISFSNFSSEREGIVGFIARYHDYDYWSERYTKFFFRKEYFKAAKVSLKKQAVITFANNFKINIPLEEFEKISANVQFNDPKVHQKAATANRLLEDRFSKIGLVQYEKYQASIKFSSIILRDGTNLKVTDDPRFIRHLTKFLDDRDTIHFPTGLLINRDFLVKNMEISFNNGGNRPTVRIRKESGPERGESYFFITRDHLEQACEVYHLNEIKEFAAWKLKWML